VTLSEFKKTLNSSLPPEVPSLLKALWYDANNNWDKAHSIAQDIHSSEGSWIHAYLHRKEGDLPNAKYWYNMAGRMMPTYSLQKEWDEIVSELLA
jgi:hypothetical protein